MNYLDDYVCISTEDGFAIPNFTLITVNPLEKEVEYWKSKEKIYHEAWYRQRDATGKVAWSQYYRGIEVGKLEKENERYDICFCLFR